MIFSIDSKDLLIGDLFFVISTSHSNKSLVYLAQNKLLSKNGVPLGFSKDELLSINHVAVYVGDGRIVESHGQRERRYSPLGDYRRSDRCQPISVLPFLARSIL